LFSAFFKAIHQLSDRSTQRILVLVLVLAIGVFFGLWFLVGFLVSQTVFFQTAWLETLVDLFGAVVMTFIVTWFLFPAVISGFIAFFLDDIVRAVEKRYYPQRSDVPAADFFPTLWASFRFISIMVVLNLFILIFLLLPPVFPFVFYGVNGYLLGREYFELVAQRRIGRKDVLGMRKAFGGRLFIAGLLIAFLMTVPGINLLAPVIATAAMVHLFESWQEKWPAGAPSGV
jgi:CysZ protein